VARAFTADRPIDSSLFAVSVTQTTLLASTDAALPASKVRAIASGGPAHLGSGTLSSYVGNYNWLRAALIPSTTPVVVEARLCAPE
jgi:hypothetical protein